MVRYFIREHRGSDTHELKPDWLRRRKEPNGKNPQSFQLLPKVERAGGGGLTPGQSVRKSYFIWRESPLLCRGLSGKPDGEPRSVCVCVCETFGRQQLRMAVQFLLCRVFLRVTRAARCTPSLQRCCLNPNTLHHLQRGGGRGRLCCCCCCSRRPVKVSSVTLVFFWLCSEMLLHHCCTRTRSHFACADFSCISAAPAFCTYVLLCWRPGSRAAGAGASFNLLRTCAEIQ